MGKDVKIYNEDETPDRYRFLPGSDVIVHAWPNVSDIDTAFILDCSNLERMGRESSKLAAMKNIVNIDHHIENGAFSDLNLRDEDASSTGEMLYRLFLHMGVPLSKDAATSLYAAILTDTGGFRYRNTGKETLSIAGRLVGEGADPQWISENIYDSEPLEKIRLLSKTLETLRLDLDDKVASMIVYQRTLDEIGAGAELTEGFVELPRSIRSVQISILYSELANRQFKLSLRSKGRINVEKIARIYGGGGHPNAAAFKMEGEFEAIKRDVLHTINRHLTTN